MSGTRSLGELARLFLRLRFAGFGGPLAHIGIMETEVVDCRRWLTRRGVAALADARKKIEELVGELLAADVARRRPKRATPEERRVKTR